MRNLRSSIAFHGKFWVQYFGGNKDPPGGLMTHSKDITQLLKLWQTGDKEAEAQLVDVVQRDIKQIVRRELSGKNLAFKTTEMFDELFLRLLEKPPSVDYKNRNHFYAICAKIFKNIIADEFRSRNAQKRGSGLPDLVFESEIFTHEERPIRIGELSCALEEFEKMDSQKALMVELRFFVGLSVQETAQIMNISTPTVKRGIRLAKAWLFDYLT